MNVTRTLDVTPPEKICGDTAVMRVLDALYDLPLNGVLEVICNDAEHVEAITLWSQRTKRKFEAVQQGKVTRFYIQKTK